jgi:hypothetical protein
MNCNIIQASNILNMSEHTMKIEGIHQSLNDGGEIPHPRYTKPGTKEYLVDANHSKTGIGVPWFYLWNLIKIC